MKKTLLIVLSIFAFSCSDDDNTTTATESELVGKWKPVSVTYQGETSDISYPCPQNGVVWLQSNGTIVEYSSDGDNCEVDTFTYTYVLDGSVVTLNDNGYVTKANVLTATSTNLKLEWFYDSDTGEYTDNQKEVIQYQKIE